MIAVDTNILVYAHREDSAWHDQAAAAISELAVGTVPWAIPWPCVHEFLAVVTHTRIFDPPTPTRDACDQVDAWFESPSLTCLFEGPGYWPALRELALTSQIAGARVHDARIAALCVNNGVSELWTADRNFSRFPALAVRNPLITRPT